jgi:hypothetical protein
MDAKITILSGKSQRGQEMGCTGHQVYAVLVGPSGDDLFVSGPCDDDQAARTEAQRWAEANGVQINGSFQPRAITGSGADIRANSRRF